MRCPECSKQRTRVTRGAVGPGRYDAPATYVLIGLNVLAFMAEVATGAGGLSTSGSSVAANFALFGPSVAEGEWYRLLTCGFLHASLIHIGFNMLLLFLLGRLLEPTLGTPRFLALYFASLLAGSLGALVLDPNALTLGASGAIFGLASATFIIARGRGMDAIAGEIGFLIVFNLIWTFASPGNISAGGHLGGLVGGVICALFIVAGERGMLGARRLPLEILAMSAVGLVSILGALAIA
jgi:membrane associated rhomboid family serine protease